jgi:hypothetical protein
MGGGVRRSRQQAKRSPSHLETYYRLLATWNQKTVATLAETSSPFDCCAPQRLKSAGDQRRFIVS